MSFINRHLPELFVAFTIVITVVAVLWILTHMRREYIAEPFVPHGTKHWRARCYELTQPLNGRWYVVAYRHDGRMELHGLRLRGGNAQIEPRAFITVDGDDYDAPLRCFGYTIQETTAP